MAMIVEITNVTDAPDSKLKPTQVSIYTQKLNPGEVLKLPAHMVDERLRKLEKGGYVAIGPVPSWYEASKRRGRPPLSHEEAGKLAIETSKRRKKAAQKDEPAKKLPEPEIEAVEAPFEPAKEEKTDSKKRR